jgi:hypothetical protein
MTAPQGRCAGCLETGVLREVVMHFAQCDDWGLLYQAGKNPLEPAAEYARWLEQDRDAEHAADLAFRVDDTVARRTASADRFTEPDLLGDDDEHDRTLA